VHRLPGRLLHTNVIGCTIFAAVSGSSAATCATIGKMTCPSWAARLPGSHGDRFPVGLGTLGLLIPPSIIMIVYGVAAEVSISAAVHRRRVCRHAAGGAVLGLHHHLGAAPSDRCRPAETQLRGFWRKLRASRSLIPVVLLIAFVLGSIYAGIATATEAAAVGVVGALAHRRCRAR
jgi:C4-dicarboxylate transporter DctM subunit